MQNDAFNNNYNNYNNNNGDAISNNNGGAINYNNGGAINGQAPDALNSNGVAPLDAGFDSVSSPTRKPTEYVEDYLCGIPARGMAGGINLNYDGPCNFTSRSVLSSPSVRTPIYMVKSTNMWISEAQGRPDPVKLWDSLWFEGELCCLFADTNVGKTLYAVQIAREIASRGYNVLYFDFELSDKQFQMRYTAEDGSLIPFPSNFLRAQMQNNTLLNNLFQTVEDIDHTIAHYKAEVVIIDNITWLCNSAESGDAAGQLMSLLLEIKRRRGVSILCLAHTPKRALDSPITQNTLAGSKRIANFMDSVFAIGIDRTNLPSGRYVKQIKVRNDSLRYGEENVIRYEIDRAADGFLGFRHIGFGKEHKLINIPLEEKGSGSIADDYDAVPAPGSRLAEIYDDVAELLEQGISYRKISQQLGVSSKTIAHVAQLVKRNHPEELAPGDQVQ